MLSFTYKERGSGNISNFLKVYHPLKSDIYRCTSLTVSYSYDLWYCQYDIVENYGFEVMLWGLIFCN